MRNRIRVVAGFAAGTAIAALLAGPAMTARAAEAWTAPNAAAADDTTITPPDLVARTPRGELHNPYKDSDATIVADGGRLFLGYGCNACHGDAGEGGMCPSLTDDLWIYGGDDDTLFRLVADGTDVLQRHGYARHGKVNVVGAMPPFGGIVGTSADLWKILAFIRSKYRGDPGYKFGASPPPPGG